MRADTAKQRQAAPPPPRPASSFTHRQSLKALGTNVTTSPERRIPIFPLGLVLFPYAPLPLHIFEERYRAMVKDVLARDRRFGIVLAHGPSTEGVSHRDQPTDRMSIARIGTIAEVTDATPYADGRYDITCAGRDRFELLAPHGGRPYLEATVRLLEEPTGLSGNETADTLDQLAIKTRANLAGVLTHYAAATPNDATRHEQLARLLTALPTHNGALAYVTARLLPTATITERQHLLEADTTADRLRLIMRHLERESRVARQLAQVHVVHDDGDVTQYTLN